MTLPLASAPLRQRIARDLEAGAWDGVAARALSRAWGAIASRTIARPLVWRPDARVVAVGGATLGGSGKTPLAIACAHALAARGARVVFVAHGYRATPGEARVVRVDDPVALVGDEALVAARSLARVAPVVVAPSRQAALDHALAIADVAVIDGVLQTSPRRASLSLLALDAESPWGSGAVVPRGDLRAPRVALLEACDHAVLLGAETTTSLGAHAPTGLVRWSDLPPVRIGLFLALARPGRVLRSLARRGVTPSRVATAHDHLGPTVAQLREMAGAPVDLWLATPKCAVHLEGTGLPFWTLDYALDPGEIVLRALASLL